MEFPRFRGPAWAGGFQPVEDSPFVVDLAKIKLRKFDELLDGVVDASHRSVVSAYEQRISVLERVKVLLRERLDKRAAPKTLGGSFAFAMRFLSSPWRAWKNAGLALRTTVRSAAFLGAPAAQSEAGTSNPRNRLYVKVSGDLTTMKCEMARWGGFEPPTP